MFFLLNTRYLFLFKENKFRISEPQNFMKFKKMPLYLCIFQDATGVTYILWYYFSRRHRGDVSTGEYY